MKIAYKIFVLFVASCFIVSCEEDDVFTGSPAGTNLQFETLKGSIVTTETHVVAAQTIPVTITIPKAFPVDTKLQATCFVNDTGKRSTKSFVMPAGDTTLAGTMQMPSADIPDLKFDMTVEMFLSGITTDETVDTRGFLGKQYTLTSDRVVMNFGDSPMSALNSNRLIVRLDFEYPNVGSTDFNNLNISFRKNGTITTIGGINATTQPIFGQIVANNNNKIVSFNNALAEDNNYTLALFATRLKNTPPADVKYRFTVRFPNDISKVYYGTLSGLTIGTAATAIPKLQIVKTTGTDGVAQYSVTQL